jgi:hypothetical protein
MQVSRVKTNPAPEKNIDTNKINLIKNQIKSNNKSGSKQTPIKSDKKPTINSANKNRTVPLKKEVNII